MEIKVQLQQPSGHETIVIIVMTDNEIIIWFIIIVFVKIMFLETYWIHHIVVNKHWCMHNSFAFVNFVTTV